MRILRNLSLVYFPQMLPHCQNRTMSNVLVPSKLISPPSSVNPSHLLRVRVVLYQQQNSSDAKLYSNLQKINFSLSHEFFIQVCCSFPFSWKPIYRFFKFSLTQQPDFCHSSVTYNKMLDVYGRSKNIVILWEFVHRVAEEKLATDATFRIVVKHLAAARELKKCIEFFHLMNENGFYYRVEILNKVVETICGQKMVDEAKLVIMKMKPWIKPSEVTYGFLVSGFCDRGDLVEACKIWNLMAESGLLPEVSSSEKIIERFFKCDRLEDGLIFFKTIRLDRFHDVGPSTYQLVIVWMCKKQKLLHALYFFCEVLKRGMGEEDRVISALVYCLLCKRKVREAFKVFNGLRAPHLMVCNMLIKGLLKLRKKSEATEVFRLMCHRGCEPNMHTYIMLLQGHLGKRGRKGPHAQVNFENIFVGGLVKVGKTLEATKYVERKIKGASEVPRFDYNTFLHEFSRDEGTVMFREVGARLREVGLVDLGDIFIIYGDKMTSRDRRRRKIGDVLL